MVIFFEDMLVESIEFDLKQVAHTVLNEVFTFVLNGLSLGINTRTSLCIHALNWQKNQTAMQTIYVSMSIENETAGESSLPAIREITKMHVEYDLSSTNCREPVVDVASYR